MAEWSYSFGDYTLVQDELCHWWLKRSGVVIYNCVKPQPLIEKALREKWLSVVNAVELNHLLSLEV